MKKTIFAKFTLILLMFTLVFSGCSGGEEPITDPSAEPADAIVSETQSTEESSDVSTESSDVSVEESSNEPDVSDISDVSDESTENSDVSEPEDKLPVSPDHNENPLTGMLNVKDAAVGKRPVAIMIGNTRPALPQYGVEQADIIFEIPAEGGLTRFMALYGDYTQIPEVGSVRSCRKYFPAISESFDAIYVNFGRDKVIDSYLETLNLTQYDGNRNNKDKLFTRSQQRINAGFKWEHTVVFDGPAFPKVLEKNGDRTDIEEDKLGTAFNFNAYGTQIPANGKDCTFAYIDFGSNEAGLKYNKETDTYFKYFFETPQVDGITGNELSFTNVIILETTVGKDSNGKHKDVDWKGGKGYYLSGGKVQNITWSKADEQSKLKLFDENGKELSINRGKSYIAICPKGGTELK